MEDIHRKCAVEMFGVSYGQMTAEQCKRTKEDPKYLGLSGSLQIQRNLIEAIRVVDAEPDNLVDLDTYERETPCGTLHCTAGLLAHQPYFQAQGLRLLKEIPGRDHLTIHNPFPTFSNLFGILAWDRLFTPRSEGVWDEELIREFEAPNEDDEPTQPAPTDKQLALARLRKQLEELRP